MTWEALKRNAPSFGSLLCAWREMRKQSGSRCGAGGGGRGEGLGREEGEGLGEGGRGGGAGEGGRGRAGGGGRGRAGEEGGRGERALEQMVLEAPGAAEPPLGPALRLGRLEPGRLNPRTCPRGGLPRLHWPKLPRLTERLRSTFSTQWGPSSLVGVAQWLGSLRGSLQL